VSNETTVEKTQEEKESFVQKTQEFKKDMAEICEKYGCCMLGAVYFREEDLSGAQVFGKLNHVEEGGLAKLIEQKFVA
jgi:hypothetical protein